MNLGNETETFQERHQYFFQNCSYRFEGLAPATKEAFQNIILKLRGTIDRHSKYCLTEKSYFEREDNKNRDDLYSIKYIEDCLDACDILDIKPYRFLTNEDVHDCQCPIAKHVLRVDSCQSYYYNNICCSSCHELKSISNGITNNLKISTTDVPWLYRHDEWVEENFLNLLSDRKKKYEMSLQASKSSEITNQHQIQNSSSSEYESYNDGFDTCYSSSDFESNEDQQMNKDHSNNLQRDSTKCVENNMTGNEVSLNNKIISSNKEKLNISMNIESSISEESPSLINKKRQKNVFKKATQHIAKDMDYSSNDEYVQKKCKTPEKHTSTCQDNTVLESDDSGHVDYVLNQILETQQKPSCSKNNIDVMDTGDSSKGTQLSKSPKNFQCTRSERTIDIQHTKAKQMDKLDSDSSSNDEPVPRKSRIPDEGISRRKRNTLKSDNSDHDNLVLNPLNRKSQLNENRKKFESARTAKNIDFQKTREKRMDNLDSDSSSNYEPVPRKSRIPDECNSRRKRNSSTLESDDLDHDDLVLNPLNRKSQLTENRKKFESARSAKNVDIQHTKTKESDRRDSDSSSNNEPLPKKSRVPDKYISTRNDSNTLDSDDSDHDNLVLNHQLRVQQKPSSNNVQSANSAKNIDVQKRCEWWLHLPENLRDDNPYFVEPRRMENDRRRGATYTLDEKRLMIAYLVVKKKIPYAKSRQPWIQMHADGYMRHRSVESLSNNFRKIIIKDIDSFGLPLEIRLKFRLL